MRLCPAWPAAAHTHTFLFFGRVSSAHDQLHSCRYSAWLRLRCVRSSRWMRCIVVHGPCNRISILFSDPPAYNIDTYLHSRRNVNIYFWLLHTHTHTPGEWQSATCATVGTLANKPRAMDIKNCIRSAFQPNPLQWKHFISARLWCICVCSIEHIPVTYSHWHACVFK